MYVFRAAHAAKDTKKSSISAIGAATALLPGAGCGRDKLSLSRSCGGKYRRDLEALLNSVALESTVDMTDVPYARKSIINFGLPDVSNRTIDGKSVGAIPANIKTSDQQLRAELPAAALDVERDMTVDPAELKVRFIVRADLTCEPVHVPVEFVADVDRYGKVIIYRL